MRNYFLIQHNTAHTSIITVVLMMSGLFFLASCGSFHIAKRKYNDGLYVDYSKSENPRAKINRKTEKHSRKKAEVQADSSETVCLSDTLVTQKKDSINNTIETANLDSADLMDTVRESEIIKGFLSTVNIDNSKIQEQLATKEIENFVLFITCIVLPPYAIILKFGQGDKKLRSVIFWTIMGWVPGVFYAFIKISADD